MEIRILPSSLDNPGRHQVLITYLIDHWLAIDAGCLGIALPPEEQCRVTDVIITHSHQDHIASLPIFLTNVFACTPGQVVIHAQAHDQNAIRQHVLNDVVWPDFTRIESAAGPVVKFSELVSERPFDLRGFRITPIAVNHIVPTIGVAIEDQHSGVVFTSDTYCTEKVWQLANSMKRLDAVFVDVSFPSGEAALAEASKHLTPGLLGSELRKLRRECRVYAVHLKSNYHERVAGEVAALEDPRVSVAEIGKPYRC